MSAPVVYAAPYVPPAPPIPPYRGLGMTWTGWDGAAWDLTSADKGVFIENGRGLRGLAMPEHERWSRSAPLVPGSTHLGHQVKDRTIFWPLAIYSDQSSAEWMARDRAFWRTMDPDREGTWTVVHPSGERRYLKCRFLDDNNHKWDADQLLKGWDRYGLTLLADYPYWRGDVVSREFSEAELVDFLDPADPAIITISAAGSFEGASIDNPGDIPASLVWWLHGPFTSIQVGVGSRIITVPFSVAEGKTLVVDTHPTRRTAKQINTPTLTAPVATQVAQVEARLPTATNRTRLLDASSDMTAVVPAGGVSEVSIAAPDPSRVRVLLTPSYRRAW